MGYTHAALTKCRAAATVKPPQPLVLYFQALVLQRIRQQAKAAAILEKIADDSRPQVYRVLGGLYLQMAKLDQAKKYYLKAAADKSPGILLNLGMICDQQQDKREAMRYYMQIVEQTKETPKSGVRAIALNNLAWLSLKTNPSFALSCAKQAYKQNPASWQTIDTLASAYFHDRQYTKALRYFLHAKDLNPSSAGIHYHLGQVYAKLKKKQQAKDALQRALSLDPNFSEAKKAKQLLESLGK